MKNPGMTNSFSNSNSDIFEWSEENFIKVKQIISKYPHGRQQSAVIPILDLAQRQNNGWLTKNIIEKVSETLQIPDHKITILDYGFDHKRLQNRQRHPDAQSDLLLQLVTVQGPTSRDSLD